ncbi:MAG: hypothetical protein ACXWLJ_07395, partial [Rhizomicrobium sp.]
GRIYARKVLLCATSQVEGDILQESFAVETGAFFEGTCRRSENPLGDDTKKAVSKQPAQHSSQTGLALTSLQTT